MTRFHEVFDRIPPINGIKASDMRRAGYPEARLSDHEYHRWNEVHAWCKAHFRDRYTWCGEQFFFVDKDDMMLFAMRWS